MEFQTSERNVRIATVAITQRVDAFTAPALQEHLTQLSADGIHHIVLDLAETPFLASAGLAVLVTAMKRARQGGGDVKVVRPQDETVQRIFALTKFDRVFDLYDTVDEAAQAFAGR